MNSASPIPRTAPMPPPHRGRPRSRCPDDLPADLLQLLGRVRRSDAATLGHRLAPVIGEIDAAVLAGRITWSEIALALDVPRTSAYAARERARTIAAQLHECGLLPAPTASRVPTGAAIDAASSQPEPVFPPAAAPLSSTSEGPRPQGFRAAVYDPAPPLPPDECARAEQAQEAEPVGAALRRMIEAGHTRSG